MDPYTNPDHQSDTTIQAMATRLEERAAHPIFSAFIADYAGTLPKDRPLRLLEVGCGTGAVLRQLQPALHADSELHGADISEKLLAAAHNLSQGCPIHWQKLTGTDLPYASASFDVVLMHTLLGHVPDPSQVLREAFRVLRPEARLIVFEADHASTTFALSDYEKTRETDHKLVSAIATHPDICRQLPRLLKSAAFTLTAHKAHPLSECPKGDFWLSSVHGFSRLIPALGILSKQEGEAWTTHLLRAHEEGTFFAAGIFYTFQALKKQTPL
jgi:2-polyprenyl-3-methyl-5-hydroxy-6-metoxy-1,4-benzoquinol methylase